jgi:hypothetical protein
MYQLLSQSLVYALLLLLVLLLLLPSWQDHLPPSPALPAA